MGRKYQVLIFYTPLTGVNLTLGIWIDTTGAQELPNGDLYAELRQGGSVKVNATAWRKRG